MQTTQTLLRLFLFLTHPKGRYLAHFVEEETCSEWLRGPPMVSEPQTGRAGVGIHPPHGDASHLGHDWAWPAPMGPTAARDSCPGRDASRLGGLQPAVCPQRWDDRGTGRRPLLRVSPGPRSFPTRARGAQLASSPPTSLAVAPHLLQPSEPAPHAHHPPMPTIPHRPASLPHPLRSLMPSSVKVPTPECSALGSAGLWETPR